MAKKPVRSNARKAGPPACKTKNTVFSGWWSRSVLAAGLVAFFVIAGGLTAYLILRNHSAAPFETTAEPLPGDHLVVAQEHMAKGQYPETIAACRLATTEHPEKTDGWLLLSRALLFDNQPQEALSALQKGLKANPTAWQMESQEAWVLVQLHRNAEAKPIFEQIAQAHADSPDGWAGLGAIAFDTGEKVDDVVGLLEKSRKLDRNGEGRYGVALAQCYKLTGETDKAMPILQAYLKQYPFDPRGQWAMGDLLETTEEYQKAIPFLEAYLLYFPDDVVAVNKFGECEGGAGELDKAQASFLRAEKLKPDDPEVLLNLSGLMMARKRFDLAETYLKRCLALAPSPVLPVAHDRRLIPWHSYLALVWSSYGDLALKQGNRAAAIERYQKACALSPESEICRKKLQDLGVAPPEPPPPPAKLEVILPEELNEAAGDDNLQLLASLISQGGQIDEADGTGTTPILKALAMRADDAVEFLIKKGAKTDYKSETGATLLHLAAQANAVKSIGLLVKEGCSVRAKDQVGGTPLHAAAAAGSVQAIGQLIELGADINARMQDDETPLHVAAGSNQIDAIAELIRKGANLRAVTKNGLTPLQIAEKYQNDESIKILKAAEAKTAP